MIKIENLHKKYGKNEVLKGIDLNIDNRGVFAILGPNGSGKTTLIKCILGMVIPNSGEITLEGKNIQNQWKYRESIGYLPQIANFPENLRVTELIKMIKDLRQSPDFDETPYIERLGLESHLSKRLSNLSGGTKQKVNLTLTLLFDTQRIILDEPTTGLHPAAFMILRDVIVEEKQKGKTSTLSSDSRNFVEEISDEIVFLLEGKVYFKGSADMLKAETDQVNLEHAIANLLKKTEYA